MSKVELVNRSNRFKVIIVGEPRVGKTTLIKKFIKAKIIEEYMPTVGTSISKQPVKVRKNGGEVTAHLLLWDITMELKGPS